MAVTSEATTLWNGTLTGGSGTTHLDSSGAATLPVTWASRSGAASDTTTPEELLGAAHSACYSMALAHTLTEHGTPPESIQVVAAVTFQPGTGITGSHLLVNAKVPGLSEGDFLRITDEVKDGCPVSQALAGISITLEATLS